MIDPPVDVLLTVKEYAALVGCHPQSVYRAIYKQRFPYPLERPLGGTIEIRVPADVVQRRGAA